MTAPEENAKPECNIIPVKTASDIAIVATLAEEIWNQHFIPILGKDQVDYMVEKFQSISALTEQVEHGYEYFILTCDLVLAGYCGIHVEQDDTMFLSKLYIHEDFRGKRISSFALNHLIALCKERGLSKIWLTCNKYNTNTLAVYKHFGFVKVRSQVADIGHGYVMDDYILEYRID